MPLIPSYQVSHDASRALEEFSSQLAEALAVAPSDGWSTRFGLATRGAFKKTFPIPVSAARFLAREGQDRYRSIYQRSLSMMPQEYFDGVEERTKVIESPDFVGWLDEPMRIAAEMLRHGDVITAAMLEANPNLDFYTSKEDGLTSSRALFANDHPYNVFDSSYGTFDNDQTGTGIDAALAKAVRQRFATRKGPNGQSMRLNWRYLLVPPARYEEAKDFFEADNLLTTLTQDGTAPTNATGWTRNRHKGTVEVVQVHEFTNDDLIYAIADGGAYPWILQTAEQPEEIVFDKDSDHYKNTGKVKIGYVFTAGVGAALPHCIERIDLS